MKSWAIIAGLFAAGCATTGSVPHLDPPLHLAPTALAAWDEAYEASIAEGGDLYQILDTHSMEPTLVNGVQLAALLRQVALDEATRQNIAP